MPSTLIGALRVVLSADTADFKTGLSDASKATQQFTGQLSGASVKISSFGRSLGAMFTVGAIVAASKQVLDYAGNLEDLADTTGLTTDSLQEMSHVAKQTGSSLDGFTNAAFKLGVNLSDATKKVQESVEALGLSYMALRDMSPDEQFRATADALGRVENVQERNRLGVILMGKGYKEVAGSISEGYSKIADGAAKTSASSIKAISDLGDEWDKLKGTLMAVAATLIGPLAKGLNFIIDRLSKATEIVKDAADNWRLIFGGNVAEGPKVFGNAMGNLPKPIGLATLSMEEAEEAAKKLDEQVKKSIETNKDAAKAAKEAEQDRMDALRESNALEGQIREENKRFAEEAIANIDREQKAQREYFNWLGERRMEDDAITMLPIENTMTLPWVKFKDTVMQDAPGVVAKFESISESVQDIGSTIVKAFTSGGNPFKAIGSLLGEAFGNDMGKLISKNISGMLGQVLGSFAGPLGALAGSLLGKAASWIGGLFGGGKKKREEEAKRQAAEAAEWLEKMRVKAEALNGELEATQDELGDLIDKARDLGYEFDKAGNFVGVNFEKMKGAASEFGVDLNALGPAFRQQGIDAEATKIVNAFELLSKGGGDVGTILVGMKDEIGKLVAKSIDLGTTIPANMKPWIDELARTHQLVDENGKEITDLSKIKFGEPIKTEFEKISESIKELITKIGELIDKIAAIPTQKTLTVTTNHQTTGTPSSGVDDTGGDNGQGVDQGHALGTMGRYGEWFKKFPDTGMATSLHGMEAVIRPDQALPFAMDTLAGLNAGAQPAAAAATPKVQASFAIENVLMLDGAVMKDWVKRTVVTAADNNEGGFRSDMRDVIGVTT